MGILKKFEGDQRLYSDLQIIMSDTFRIWSHPGKAKLLVMLVECDDLSLKEIQNHLLLSQSATSALVKQIKETGLITGKQVGTSVRYSLDKEMWQNMMFLIRYFVDQVSNL